MHTPLFSHYFWIVLYSVSYNIPCKLYISTTFSPRLMPAPRLMSAPRLFHLFPPRKIDCMDQIKQLKEETKENRKTVLLETDRRVSSSGLQEDELNTLLDLVFEVENNLHSNEKKYIIKRLLLPNGSYKLDTSIVYRVLSNIGVPRVYSNAKKQMKEKKLSANVQILLLEWLISSIHLFGDKVFEVLQLAMPILFNLLSFEYLRPYIANLIFLGFLNAKDNIVKDWQIQRIIDLAVKFPLDDSLNNLLALVKSIVPGFDIKHYRKTSRLSPSDSRKVSMKYPNFEYLHKLETINPDTSNNTILQTCLNQYRTFSRSLKRRKVQSKLDDIEDLDIIKYRTDANSKVIYDLTSLEDLIKNINNVSMINLTTTFNEVSLFTSRLKFNFLIFKHLIDPADPTFEKLDFFLRYFIKDPNSNMLRLNFSQLVRLHPKFVELPAIQDCYNIFHEPNAVDENLVVFLIDLLKYHSVLTDLTIVKNLIKFCFDTDKTQVLFLELSIWFSILYKSEGVNSIPLLNAIIPYVYSLFTPEKLTLAQKISLLKIFNFLKSVDEDTLQQLNPNVILPPVTIIYLLFFTINPLVVSEVCGYIAFTKTYKFTPEYKNIQSDVIMDLLNFLWRNKAFYIEEGTHHKGFYLGQKFPDKVATMNVFGYSIVQVNEVGSLFHSPVWSYLSSQIVWGFEDQAEDITARHPGPLSEESIDRFMSEPNIKWLDLSYDEIKLEVLRRLDQWGFEGLVDLLSSSLRSLSQLRHH